MGLLRRKPAPPRSESERTIFFASDLHGSRVCFRKFVAAAGFYGADTLLLGGDISAKMVVPIVAAVLLVLGAGVWAFWLDPDRSVVEKHEVPDAVPATAV